MTRLTTYPRSEARAANLSLRAESQRLHAENAALRDELAELRAENARLREQNRDLRVALDAHIARSSLTGLYGPVELTAGTSVGPGRRR